MLNKVCDVIRRHPDLRAAEYNHELTERRAQLNCPLKTTI